MSRVKTYLAPSKYVGAVSSATSADTAVDTSLAGIETAAEALCDVYVNGMLLQRGANLAAGKDWFPGSNSGEIKFNFDLVVGDVVTAILRAG